jgi:Tol biopolymer transport system component
MQINRLYIILSVFVAGFLWLPESGIAQLSPALYEYPNNHLPWYTIESEHFKVHFQEGSSRSAQVTSKIAEEIYPKITSLYRLELDSKTNIVLNDREDYSNGAAYFFDNQIEIWVPALDTPLRGTHDWLWDVITHEFTHIIQLQLAMKKSRKIPAIYFQWLSYADVRRPDVLYGYPDGLVTYPFASINVPAWFAEGVAQYQRSNLYYDYWDSHRDMIFRTALLADKQQNIEEMGSFASKNSLERERIYNQGFAFTMFLVDKFGEKIIVDITDELSERGVFTIDEAITNATGTSSKKLFEEFTTKFKSTYEKAIISINETETTPIEQRGIFNFYPKTTPDGNKLAYLSDRDYKSGFTQLYIRPVDSLGPKHTIEVGQLNTTGSRLGSYHAQDPVIDRIQSSFSFSPDGSSIAYSRQKLNKYGEQYNDLYIYDLETKKNNRLTNSLRLSSPAWHPSDKNLLAVQQERGTTNLVQVNPETSAINPLTEYKDGEQVFTPIWHPDGEQIYFSFSETYTRDIYRLDRYTGQINPVLQDSLTDYRDPFLDAEGRHLYYSADPDGIFNIYRIPLGEENPQPQQLTSVIGGAFMPNKKGETLYFAEFKTDGYKISSINLSGNSPISSTNRYKLSTETAIKLLENKTNQHRNLASIDTLSPAKTEKLSQTDSLALSNLNSDNRSDPILRPYEPTYTSFSFYPVIRFDNYSQLNGNNGRLLTAGQFGDLGENLLRDMKLGTYFSSRDVTGRLNIFGGAMFGIASEPSEGIGDFFSPSRLTDLDRDLFLITEYRGLPFIEKRWSPTISVELYNLRRNVKNGLSIEEFPCTSCLPDTTSTDIAYNIWEADIFLRSKINAYNIVEIGAGYSPYRVQTDGFFSRELQQFIPSSSSEYFRSTTLTAAHVYERFSPYPNRDVAPIGLRTLLRYTYEPNKLLEEYEVEDGVLSPVYASVSNHSLEASIQFGFPAARNRTINLYGRGFSYLNQPDDYFYLDYIGGFPGMRSYPYFAIGGNTTAFTQLSYTFPMLQNLGEQIGRHTLDKLYLRLFAETGNGWGGPLKIGNNLKTGAGAELRFAFNGYYLFPLKLFVSGAYGFNKFDVTLPEAFITESSGGNVHYGNDLIFHFGLTFDFNVLNND